MDSDPTSNVSTAAAVSVLLTLVGVTLGCTALVILAGAVWAIAFVAIICLYGAYVASTRAGSS